MSKTIRSNEYPLRIIKLNSGETRPISKARRKINFTNSYIGSSLRNNENVKDYFKGSYSIEKKTSNAEIDEYFYDGVFRQVYNH